MATFTDPITALTCVATDDDVALNWTNGADDYDAVEVLRDSILIATLPGTAATGGGDVTVNFDDTVTPPVYTITVSWEEPGITAAANNPFYAISIPVNPF